MIDKKQIFGLENYLCLITWICPLRKGASACSSGFMKATYAASLLPSDKYHNIISQMFLPKRRKPCVARILDISTEPPLVYLETFKHLN